MYLPLVYTWTIRYVPIHYTTTLISTRVPTLIEFHANVYPVPGCIIYLRPTVPLPTSSHRNSAVRMRIRYLENSFLRLTFHLLKSFFNIGKSWFQVCWFPPSRWAPPLAVWWGRRYIYGSLMEYIMEHRHDILLRIFLRNPYDIVPIDMRKVMVHC
jgi:hypothetical protein